MCNLFKTTPQWSKPSWERFLIEIILCQLPIFPYVTGVKLKYCSQGIPTTGFYLNHAFMLWHTLKWSVIKLTSIHQKILSSFDYSICVVNSNVTILRPILYTYFFFRELPHIYIHLLKRKLRVDITSCSTDEMESAAIFWPVGRYLRNPVCVQS